MLTPYFLDFGYILSLLQCDQITIIGLGGDNTHLVVTIQGRLIKLDLGGYPPSPVNQRFQPCGFDKP
jgi:hypothetical protein